MDSRSCDARPSRSALDLARAQAARADLDLRDLVVDQNARDLEVRLPDAAHLVVRVRDVVPEGHALLAHVALFTGHDSALDQLDTRHLGSVTLAVTDLENARIAAIARRETNTDLLEEQVGGLAMLDVATRETPRMQRSGLRLGDQLLHERTELLGLRLRRLDRTPLDQR